MASPGPADENTSLSDLVRSIVENRKLVFQLQKDKDDITERHHDRIVKLKKILECKEREELEECAGKVRFLSDEEEEDISSEDISSSEDERENSEKSNNCWEQFDDLFKDYNEITDEILKNGSCNKEESNVKCLQRKSEEYDKLSEQSRLLLAEQTGLTNENINLREDLQVAQQQLRKGKKVTEKVERANARLARREEKLGRHNKKLKEKLPELKDLLGCGNEQLIPCAKNYIEEHRSIKEKNEQFKLQLGLASDKFKCEDGETPEVCFNRKSIIDTIDLQSAVGALQCNPGQKLADCANRFAEENKKELKETTETSPRATAFLDHDFTREEVVTQLKQVHTLGCLALPFTLPLFVALF